MFLKKKKKNGMNDPSDEFYLGLPPSEELPCGGIAHFDIDSGYAYRCETCLCVIGSVGISKHCKDLMEMEDVINKLKGKK